MKEHELEKKLQEYFEAEANCFQLPCENKLQAFGVKHTRKIVPLRKFMVIAACFLLAVCIAAVPFLQREPFAHGNNSFGNEESTKSSDENSFKPPMGSAPWENGNLHLTSVTYKRNALSQTNSFGGSLQFAAQTSTQTENIAISMLANTKISGCVNANLLSISPPEGEHEGCDGVYYDIREDRVFCLACHIKEEIKNDPYYIDICIRSLIEEYLITEKEIFAGIVDYKPMYLSLDNETAKAYFASGGIPSCEVLAFDYGDRNTEYYDALMRAFRYPTVRVIEYGENIDRCLFTIGSPISEASWGAYVFELDTSKVTKLDGETVGLPYAINGYMGGTPDELLTVNLSLATGISVSADYSKIIVTLPYFMEQYDIDETGRLVPVYTGQNVIVFDTARGTHEGLLGNNPHQNIKQLDLPAAHAKSYKDMICYPTADGAWCLYANGFRYKLQGELLRLIERDGGGYTAVMKKATTYEAFALETEQATPIENEDIHVLDGNNRILISNATSEILWDKEPCASVFSADGRYAYLYFEGDDHISCIDIDSGKRGQLALSDDFVAQVKGAPHTEYLLFLNPSENRLLIAYYKNGALVFDSAAFLENETLLQDTAEFRITYIFEHNFKKALPYFYNEKTKVLFTNQDAVVDTAKLLGMQGLYDLAANDGLDNMSGLIIEVATQIAHLADYSGSTAEISGQTLNELFGGMTFDTFEELYEDLYDHFLTIRYTDNIFSSILSDDNMEVMANDIASGILTYVYGYVPFSEEEFAYFKEHMPAEYRAYVELYRRLNEGIDQQKMELLQARLADYLTMVLTEAGIDAEDPTYTGYQLNSLLELHLSELISIALDGGTYIDFIRSCGFIHPYSDAYYSGRTDKRFDSILLSEKYAVDGSALESWLKNITFAEGTVDIVREAGIFMEWEVNLFYASYGMYPGTEIIVAGHGTDGNAYAAISGFYAEITEEQLVSFYEICGSGTPYNREAGVTELLDQIRKEIA